MWILNLKLGYDERPGRFVSITIFVAREWQLLANLMSDNAECAHSLASNSPFVVSYEILLRDTGTVLVLILFRK